VGLASRQCQVTLTRYLRVGMAARMRVSSVIFWALSRGTFRSARTYNAMTIKVWVSSKTACRCLKVRHPEVQHPACSLKQL